MEKRIITISREYGAGGRTVGRMIADRLGIPFYDKQLVKQVAQESGFAAKYIESTVSTPPAAAGFPMPSPPRGFRG